MSEKTDAKQPKIISIATRRELTEAEKPVYRTPEEPDRQLIEILEHMLADARRGDISGALILTVKRTGDEKNEYPHFERYWTPPVLKGVNKGFAAAAMVGGVSMLAEDAADIAFWTNGYDPLCVEAYAEDSMSFHGAVDPDAVIESDDDPGDGSAA